MITGTRRPRTIFDEPHVRTDIGPDTLIRMVLESGRKAVPLRIAGGQHILILADIDGVRRVLSGNKGNYLADSGAHRRFRDLIGEGIVGAPEARWRPQRRTLEVALRDTAMIDSALTESVMHAVTELERVAARNTWVDLTQLMSRVTSRIMLRGLFGIIDDDGTVSAALHRCRPALDTAAEPTASADPIDAYDEVADLYSTIRDHVRSLPAAQHGPVLQTLIADPGHGEEQMYQQIAVLSATGLDTTAHAVTWAWINLMRHRAVYADWQARLQGDDRDEWTHAVFDETLRLCPPTWMLTRRAVDTDEIGAYTVPAKSSVLISPYLFGRHRRYWERPEKFDPGRFASDAKLAYPDAYLPFGAAGRYCPAARIAHTVASTVLAELGSRFTFTSPAAHRAKPIFGSVLRAPALPVTVTPASVTRRKRGRPASPAADPTDPIGGPLHEETPTHAAASEYPDRHDNTNEDSQ